MLIKWKLMVTTLPFVLAVVVLRLILDFVVQFPGVVEFSDVGMVLTGGVFLIGVMLSGTLSDYKESEKLPAEIACTLETIEETFRLAAVGRPVLSAPLLQQQVLDTSSAILDWLTRKLSSEQVFQRLDALNNLAHAVERAGAPVLASRTINELSGLRRAIARLDVISKTSFLQSGYALLETVVVAVIALQLLARYKSPIAEYTLITFVTLIFIYMLRLIKDIDDPFEYAPDGQRSGAAEVDLFPLHDYRKRAAARLGQ